MNFIFDKLHKFLFSQQKLKHLTERCTILSYFGRFPYPAGADMVRESVHVHFKLHCKFVTLPRSIGRKSIFLLASSQTCMLVCLRCLFLIVVNNGRVRISFFYQLADFCMCLFFYLQNQFWTCIFCQKKFLILIFFIKLLGQREK